MQNLKLTIAKLGAVLLAIVTLSGCGSLSNTNLLSAKYSILIDVAEGKNLPLEKKYKHLFVAEEIAKTYAKLEFDQIDALSMRSMNDDVLKILFDANGTAIFYSNYGVYNEALENVLDEMLRRGLASKMQIAETYNLFLRTRDFNRATKFAAKHDQALEPLPKLVTETSGDMLDIGTSQSGQAPTEWVLSKSERVATLQPASLGQDWLMVVVSSPKCSPSNRAVQAIYRDRDLADRIKKNTKWIVGQSTGFEFEKLQKWNNRYPEAAFTIVHLDRDWPLDNLALTPTFYFLQNGKVIESFSGWPDDGSHKIKLITALNRIAPK